LGEIKESPRNKLKRHGIPRRKVREESVLWGGKASLLVTKREKDQTQKK